MTPNKICFIHLRLKQADHKAQRYVKATKGGVTVAWTIRDNGDIQIGAPALCSIKDHYIKAVGRNIAKTNLSDKVAYAIPAEQLRQDATARLLEEAGEVKSATKPLMNAIAEILGNAVTTDINTAMSSHWFEAQVHNAFTFSVQGSDLVFQFNGVDEKHVLRNALVEAK